jgi:HPt (histidine-containing phosphotransfer) domain-containing protein
MSALPGTAIAEVLDAGALERLRELDPSGKGGLVARVLATYTSSLGKLLQQFQAARVQGDRAALRHVAHTLRSSSASVGALHLSGLCADIERSVREGLTEGLDAKLDAMAAEAARVLAALRAS